MTENHAGRVHLAGIIEGLLACLDQAASQTRKPWPGRT